MSINQVMLQEDIAQGQRIEEFTLEAWRGDKWEPFAKATTIGYKRLLRFPEIKTSKVRLTITATRAGPALSTLGLFWPTPVASYSSSSDGNHATVPGTA